MTAQRTGQAGSSGDARPGYLALAAAMDGVEPLLGAARAAVLWPGAGGWRVLARRGYTEQGAAALACVLDEPPVAGRLSAGEPVSTLASGDGQDGIAALLRERVERWFLALPLSGGDPSGVLALGFPTAERMTPARIEAARSFAALLGAALAAARRGDGQRPTAASAPEPASSPPVSRRSRRPRLPAEPATPQSSPSPAAPGSPVSAGAAPEPAPHLRSARPAPPAQIPSEPAPGAPEASDIERRLAFAFALNDALTAATAELSIEAAARAAADVLVRAMPHLHFVHVWVVEDGGKRFVRVAAGGKPEAADAVDGQIGGQRLLGLVDRLPDLKEPRIASWHGDPARWPAAAREHAQRLGVATLAYVPLASRGKIIGAILLGSRDGRPLTAAEGSFLTTFAGQLGGQLDVVRGHARAEAERRRLVSVIETLPEGLIIVHPDGRPSMYNQAAADIAGWRPGGPTFTPAAREYHPRTADGRPFAPEEMPLVRALRGETVRAVEMVVRRLDGEDLSLLCSAAPIRGPDGALAGALTVFQDISPLKELEQLKDDFINTVSHELRTPTTTIRGGALTLLKRGDRLDAETRRQLLQDIAEESERLRHLVEDLLSLSRSRAGMHITREPVRLHRLVNKVILELGPSLGSYALTVDVPHDLPLVDADPLAMEQVLRNLLENAVKYSPRDGRVEVTAEPRGDEVLVDVRDRGAGIDEADLDRVFEPFYRAPGAVRAGIQGAGLGLTVCRRLIEMQGGRIWAERRPGGGAAIRFTLPAARDAEEE